MALPQNLVNLNLFVDGRSYAGVVKSLTLPKLTLKTEEHRAGGMDAPVEVDLGMEKLEAMFTHSGVDTDIKGFLGLANQTAFNGVFRGAYRDVNGVVSAVAITLRGTLKEDDPGDWKPGEAAENKFAVGCFYYKAEVDGQIVHEVDKINCIRRIGGVDQLADVRAALGI
jgi:P2 family phage contractile tail tube protein